MSTSRYGWIFSRASTLAALVWSGALIACGNVDSGRYVVADSTGIMIVQNLGADRRLPVRPERLGSLQPPDSALTAMPWAVVADPGSGRIFVGDATSERVVVFDASGTFVRSIGRAGEGPGEFRSPTALALDPGRALAVWDARRGVISRWSPDGALLDERRAPVNYWGPGFAIRGDGVLAVTQSTTGSQRRQ
ncbi:MAG TPA: 6-bladed beta-propeller, partial [Longimicrobiales bacterium]|nr:6-bladed beta-propeller [Longimicrobiales bacterium]